MGAARLLLLALALTLVGWGSAQPPSAFNLPCDPPVGTVRFGSVQDPAVEQRLKVLYEADQAARTGESIDQEALRVGDAERRVEVLQYLTEGKVISGWSQYHAAMILQHGTCPDHYQLANQLAEKAMDQGIDPARWLYAASMDRFLLSQGKPQRYGTQYTWVDGRLELGPVDPATTDAERAKYDVPPLEQAKAMNFRVPGIKR